MIAICRNCKELKKTCSKNLCQKCYRKKYYIENREELRMKKKKYNDNHREERKAYNKKYRKEHKEEIIIKDKAYRIKHLKEIKVFSKKYRAENRERINAQKKEYRKENPGKARDYKLKRNKYGNPEKKIIEKVVNENILKYGIITCERCNKKCLESSAFHVDHIIPLSKGGFNTYDNLQILCAKCNQSKNIDIADYRKNIRNDQMYLC